MLHSSKRDAFTLVELMIVVVIVAILALVAIPLYQGNVLAAQMSEGVSGVGTIRTALRVYAASHNNQYPTDLSGKTGAELTDLGIAATDLDGKYFKAANYALTVGSATTYSISATMGANTYIIDQDGAETGTYKTNQ